MKKLFWKTWKYCTKHTHCKKRGFSKYYWVWFFDSRSRFIHFWHTLLFSKVTELLPIILTLGFSFKTVRMFFFFLFWWWMELRWVFKKVEKFFSLLSSKSFFFVHIASTNSPFWVCWFWGGKNIDIVYIWVYRAITDQDGFCLRNSVK